MIRFSSLDLHPINSDCTSFNLLMVDLVATGRTKGVTTKSRCKYKCTLFVISSLINRSGSNKRH